MKIAKLKLCAATVLATSFAAGPPVHGQIAYVSDGHNDTVEAIEVSTSTYLGPFIHSSNEAENYKIAGPRGVIFAGNFCVVANQNVNLPVSGEILKFDANTGAFISDLVASWDPHAPFAPRGIVACGDDLYVADQGDFDSIHPGQVLRFRVADGAYLGQLDTTGFDKMFNPRGLVIGADGLLYVSVTGNLAAGDRAPGYVVRFQWDPITSTGKYKDKFVSSDASNNYAPTLHRPEGLVFGPNGNLYVTTFLQGNDQDGVVVFNASGQKIGRIDWWVPGQSRVFAQAALFGPRGDLFVPLTSGVGMRRYSSASSYHNFSLVPRTGKSLQEGWYMSFRETNPATLAFEP